MVETVEILTALMRDHQAPKIMEPQEVDTLMW